MIYQMMNGRISKRTLTKMIKAYYMCAQNGVVYKGYTEWTGDANAIILLPFIPYFIISELISILNELNIINETTKYLK